MRDFNALLNIDEKKGGSVASGLPCKLFQKFIADSCLRDVGFQGSKYTWNRGLVFERLDRALCNYLWEVFVPDSMVLHLHKSKSDHWPLTINFGLSLNPKLNRPFRFFSGWLAYEGFGLMIADN